MASASFSLPVLLSSIVAASLAGYYIGQISHSPPGVRRKPTADLQGSRSAKAQDNEDDEEDEDSENEATAQALKESQAGVTDSGEECKLVLVVRTDLGMTKGKIAAQCSHATLACYKTLSSISSPLLRRWERLGQAKIAVQCKSEEELLTLQATAISLGICARIIHDAGRTQIAAGSATVLGVGPGPKSQVDVVTGHLKLL